GWGGASGRGGGWSGPGAARSDPAIRASPPGRAGAASPLPGALAVAAVAPPTFISRGDGSVVPAVGRLVGGRPPATNAFPAFQLGRRAAQLRRDGEPIP